MAAPEAEPKKGFPKGKDFERALPTLARHKSVVLRNYSGEIQHQQIEALRTVEREVKAGPAFAGLAFATFGYFPAANSWHQQGEKPHGPYVHVAALYDSFQGRILAINMPIALLVVGIRIFSLRLMVYTRRYEETR